MQALDDAIDLFDSTADFARAIGVPSNLPSMWRARGRVPSDHCPAIERETAIRGKPVRCESLRPDVDWAVLRKKAA